MNIWDFLILLCENYFVQVIKVTVTNVLSKPHKSIPKDDWNSMAPIYIMFTRVSYCGKRGNWIL